MWLVIGLILGIAGVMLFSWIRSRQIKLRWYEWLIGLIGLILALVAIQSYSASLIELEPRAATFFLAALGIPAVILLFLALFLPYRRTGKKMAAPKDDHGGMQLPSQPGV
jgi:uncharacterized membrane protein